MRQLIQSYKTGEMGVFSVPSPLCYPDGVLIETKCSLISAGTEKMLVDIARKSIIGKARTRPDLVKQVMDKMKKEGIQATLSKVFNKLDTPIPLGYSCSGTIIETGKNISDFSIGDRIACGGAGYANHSEINYIPKNLFVRIPENVDDIDASFVTVGGIALQGIRQAEPRIGDRVAVIGLGLIGQLTVQLLKANGCLVIGSDIDREKNDLAKKLGANIVCHTDDLLKAAKEFTSGKGIDSVIITASAKGNELVEIAGEICRLKGKVVAVGLVGMDIPRNQYYRKELDFRLSLSYGPGRYDPVYEEKGIDYPFGYVRFTEQRNFETFLEMVSEKKIRLKELITHSFDFTEALKAYNIILGITAEKYLAIVLNYSGSKQETIKKNTNSVMISNNRNSDAIKCALVGAGNFTKSVILPALKKVNDISVECIVTATGISAFATAKKYGINSISTNADEVMINPQYNAIIVTTRHSDHATMVINALSSEKHVYVEKPLCITEDDLEKIKHVYNGNSQLQVGFNRRFSPYIKKIKELVGNNPIAINYRINAGTIPKDSWIQDKDIGGGRIIGEICHFIDTCSYLTGSFVESVSATILEKNDKTIPDDDNISITLRYSNGCLATITYYAYGNNILPKEYVEVFLPGKAIQMTDYRSMVIYQGNKKQYINNRNQDKGFVGEFKAFAESVQSGKPAIPFEIIYNTTKTSFKIIESIRSKNIITINV